jgi:hypothetical protein
VFLSGRADSSGFERLRQQADTGVLLALPLARYDASRMWLNAPFPTQFRDMRYSIHHRGRTYDHEEIGQLTDADCGVFHREAHLDHALVRLATRASTLRWIWHSVRNRGSNWNGGSTPQGKRARPTKGAIARLASGMAVEGSRSCGAMVPEQHALRRGNRSRTGKRSRTIVAVRSTHHARGTGTEHAVSLVGGRSRESLRYGLTAQFAHAP